MPERRHLTANTSSTSSTSTIRPPSNVRRNLFQQHLRSVRPAASLASNSTSTSGETLRLDTEDGDVVLRDGEQDIVIRDHNGAFQIGDPPVLSFEEAEGEGAAERGEDEKERQRLVDAVKHHQRDRNRAPSEPAGMRVMKVLGKELMPTELLDAVRASLRAKVAALAEDNWMYEAENEPVNR